MGSWHMHLRWLQHSFREPMLQDAQLRQQQLQILQCVAHCCSQQQCHAQVQTAELVLQPCSR